MEKRRWLGSPEQPPKENLPSCGVEQILAANDEVDVLEPVVDSDRELVRPIPFAIANEHIAALRARLLDLRPQPKVVEPHHAVVETDSEPQSWLLPQMLIAARSGIALTVEVRSRTRARVHEASAPQRFERVLVDRVTLALTNERTIGNKSQPVEIVEDGLFVDSSASLPIVIFDAEQHGATGLTPCPVPHMDRVENVAEVQVARRRGRKARDDHDGILVVGESQCDSVTSRWDSVTTHWELDTSQRRRGGHRG